MSCYFLQLTKERCNLKSVLITLFICILLLITLTGYVLFMPSRLSPNVGLAFMATFCREANSHLFFARCNDDMIVFFQSPLQQMLAETENGSTRALVELYSLKDKKSFLANVDVKKTVDSLAFGPHAVSRDEFERLHLGKRWQRALAMARLPDHRNQIITSLGYGKFLLAGGLTPKGDPVNEAVVFDADHLQFPSSFQLKLQENPDQSLLLSSGEVIMIGGQRADNQTVQIVDLVRQSSKSLKFQNCSLPDCSAICLYKLGSLLSIGGCSNLGTATLWSTKVTVIDPCNGTCKDIAELSHGRAFSHGSGWQPRTAGLVTPDLLVICGGQKRSSNLLSVSGEEQDYTVEILPLLPNRGTSNARIENH